MLRRIISIYTIFLGLCIISLWTIILASDGMAESPVEKSFHLVSEFIMAALCLLGGILSIKKKQNSILVLLLAHGMVIYSVLNAAGYYGHNSGLAMALPFTGQAIISGIIIIYFISK